MVLCLIAWCSGACSSPGQALSRSEGCANCHGDTGQGGVGPAWRGLAGRTVRLAGGTTVTADSAYLRQSITSPQAKVVKGYTLKMPTFHLSTKQVDQLVAYIQSLK